jgi:hypothetical protein
MSNSTARFSFFVVYLVFFAVNFTLVVWSWQRYYVGTDGMVGLLKELVAIYAPQFSVILAGIFGSQSDKESLAAFVPYLAGILLVVLWNANTAWPLAYLFLKAGPQGMPVGWALDYWKSAPVLTGFLCTAALTFFFLKSSSREDVALDIRK